MTFPIERCGAVILAGGQSKRMGRCKALLEVQGETMISRLARQLSLFSELLLSANDPVLARSLPVRYIPDIYENAGPAAGLHAALSAASSDALFCVPCDMPNFDVTLIDILLSHLTPETNAVICRDGSGRLHPLCGIYAKRTLPVLQELLEQGEHRMTTISEALGCLIIDTSPILPDSIFFNMNTPEAYRLAMNDQ